MLPKDTAARKAQAAETTQSQLDGHLKPLPPKERAVVYSDARFRQAAVQWVIATDQVCPNDINFVHEHDTDV